MWTERCRNYSAFPLSRRSPFLWRTRACRLRRADVDRGPDGCARASRGRRACRLLGAGPIGHAVANPALDRGAKVSLADGSRNVSTAADRERSSLLRGGRRPRGAYAGVTGGEPPEVVVEATGAKERCDWRSIWSQRGTYRRRRALGPTRSATGRRAPPRELDVLGVSCCQGLVCAAASWSHGIATRSSRCSRTSSRSRSAACDRLCDRASRRSHEGRGPRHVGLTARRLRSPRPAGD